jgi:hypothetical protein
MTRYPAAVTVFSLTIQITTMTEVNEHAVEELLNRGYDLSPREFVHLVERHHPTEEHGVSQETLAAYADAVAEEDGAFDPENLLDSINERLTDIEVWTEDSTRSATAG